MFFTVYKITNNLNGKYYVGKHKTENLNDKYLGSGTKIKLAIKKYGKENFTKEFLYVFDNEIDMKNKEQEIVTEDFCKLPDNYNMCEGGGGPGLRLGFKFSEESKLKMRNNNWSKRMSSPKKGVPLSEETKQKLKGYPRGVKVHTEESKLKMRKPRSEETKLKMRKLKSEAHKKAI